MSTPTPAFYQQTNEPLAMSQEPASMEPATPAMPERAIRRSEDVGRRPSVSNDPRRYWRSSEQPAALRPTGPSPNSGLSRPSEDGPPQHAPMDRQVMHWQPPHDYEGPYDDQDPSPPRDYYLVPQGVNPAAAQSPYPSSDAYSQRPYRRTVRESTEAHRPLVHGQQMARQRHPPRPHWDDEYEEEEAPRLVKRTPQKSRTGIYVVKAGGGDGGDGSDTPGEMMRLPFFSWLQGTAKNRTPSDDHRPL